MIHTNNELDNGCLPGSVMCLHGGTCVSVDGWPICACPDGYYGTYCESGNFCITYCVDFFLILHVNLHLSGNL